jgi:hypothetical protein
VSTTVPDIRDQNKQIRKNSLKNVSVPSSTFEDNKEVSEKRFLVVAESFIAVERVEGHDCRVIVVLCRFEDRRP